MFVDLTLVLNISAYACKAHANKIQKCNIRVVSAPKEKSKYLIQKRLKNEISLCYSHFTRNKTPLTSQKNIKNNVCYTFTCKASVFGLYNTSLNNNNFRRFLAFLLIKILLHRACCTPTYVFNVINQLYLNIAWDNYSELDSNLVTRIPLTYHYHKS